MYMGNFTTENMSHASSEKDEISANVFVILKDSDV